MRSAERMKNTLAICGSHPGTRDLTPWSNPAMDILVFNEAANQDWVKRWDIVLQLHNETIYRNPLNRTDPKHWEWLQRDHGKKVIYMQERDAQVPNSRRYPKAEIERMLLGGLTIATPEGLQHVSPFSNSISFAIALGLYLGYKRILLYGTEMASNTEYSYQRENFQFWLGMAVGRGVRLELHSGQSMVVIPTYGYDGDLTYTTDQFDKALKQARAALGKACETAKDANIQLGLADPLNSKELEMSMKVAFDVQVQKGVAAGMAREARKYIRKVKEMQNIAGSAIISRQEFEHSAALAEEALKKVQTQVGRIDGQLAYLHRAFEQTHNEQALAQFMMGARKLHYLGRILGILTGRIQANLQLMQDYDKRLKAAGGEKSLQAYKAQLGLEGAVI